jgi:4-deoxy-L-threo-5-hexosulose-uronate ketol-isomerase
MMEGESNQDVNPLEVNVTVNTHSTADATRYCTMTTSELRDAFLLGDLFAEGQVALTSIVDLDRAVVGSAVPKGAALEMPAPEELRCEYFCERRELGVLNIGGRGRVEVDGQNYELLPLDVLYIGRGCRQIRFASDDANDPARFYLLSYPAHAAHPIALVKREAANHVPLGSDEEANRRTIHQYIHERGAKSCQLVMGWTELAPGSVWNTMPPHTHPRRSEVYMYFGMREEHRVLHMMGKPQETRPLWVKNGEAVLSPAWSIHCACGTSNYCFCWGMGGENQRFDDMDAAPIPTLR